MERRRARAATIVAAGLAGVALLALLVAVANAGRFLVVAEPLLPSDAIFVLDGGTPARELGGAVLYRRGLAPRVVLTRPRGLVSESVRLLAGEATGQERAARVLGHAGVPASAIVRLERVVDNTEQELDADFDYARRHGFRRVILVTSPPHTRRVRLIWNWHFQSRLPALVTATPYEHFDAPRWWRSRRTLEDTIHELAGMANFLLGSPLPTFDRDA